MKKRIESKEKHLSFLFYSLRTNQQNFLKKPK